MVRPARSRWLLRPWLLLALLSLVAGGCHVRNVAVRTLEVDPASDSSTVTAPVKAHLRDGTSLHYPRGVTLVRGQLRGDGIRYGLSLDSLGTVSRVPLDSVIGMEVYQPSTDAGATMALSLVGIGATGLLAAMAAVAIFGSCPTFYTDSAGTWLLEAEGFSYSMAALYESRDVDRLRVTTGPDGMVRVEVRNEALETHYINHLELLDVRHRPDEMVLPDAAGLPLAVGRQLAPVRATDRDGRDLRPILAVADGHATRSDLDRPAFGVDGLDDRIDLEVPVPAGADSIAVVLRLRNSLLNTVLLYDVMLGARGMRALEWQSTALREIGPALEVAQWYSGNMGLRILEVTDAGEREVGRVRDTGPIAWKDVAVVIAAPRRATMRLRLEHVVDNWRIDRLTVAAVRRPQVEHLPMVAAIDPAGQNVAAVLAAVAAPDGEHLKTVPGQRFTATWQPAPLAAGESRTFLLASQGYYIEWMRRDWLATPRDTMPFRPTRRVIADAVAQWRTSQDSLELQFFNSRLPVR